LLFRRARQGKPAKGLGKLEIRGRERHWAVSPLLKYKEFTTYFCRMMFVNCVNLDVFDMCMNKFAPSPSPPGW
jgi:hypothetical protein